jgi:predicted DNA-binding antitoxin AbrB/MazE fold protein
MTGNKAIAQTLEATFENGVFVPAQRPTLADHERVRLTIETISPTPQRLETLHHRRRHRIHLNPSLAHDIAQSPEFYPDGN